MASWPPKKNAAFIFYIGLISQSDTKLLQANPTLATGDVKVATDDAAPGNLGTLPVVDADFTDRVKVSLSAGEMNGNRVTVIFSDAAGAEWTDLLIDIPTSVNQIDDLATPTNITAGTIATVTNLTNLPSIPANWLTATGIAAAALDGKGNWNIGKTGYSLLATGLDAIVSTATGMVAIAKAVWDRVLTGATHNDPTSAGKRLRDLFEVGVYENGLVWYDNNKGTAGSTDFENGTSLLPLTLITDANTILGSLPLHGIHFASNSSVTFIAPQEDLELTGEGWTVALGGQSIAGSSFLDATVSGVSTGVSNVFRECFLNACTFAGGDFVECAIAGTITLSGATDTAYLFVDCHHAGTTPMIDFGTTAATNTTVHLHGYIGTITVKNMGQAGTDVLHFDSSGGVLILDNTNVGGTINLNGTFRFDDSSSGTTINKGGAVIETVDAIKVPTDKMVFTKTNELDVNTKSINDAEVVGDGNATPWDGV